MDLGEYLQEGLLDAHLEPWDKDEALEPCKASLLEVHRVPSQLGSYHLDTGQVGGTFLLQVQQGMQGCSQEGKQGLVDHLEEGNTVYRKAHIPMILFRSSILQKFKAKR